MDVIFEKDQAGGVTKYVTANGMRIAKIRLRGLIQCPLSGPPQVDLD